MAPHHRLACFLFFAFVLPAGPTHAHFLQTHLYATESAVAILGAESPPGYRNSAYVDFLAQQPTSEDPRTYRDYLLDGVKAADLHANGLYAVDTHCVSPDWLTSACPEPGTTPSPAADCYVNDRAYWPVGDHGYNPTTGLGFYPARMADGEAIIATAEANPAFDSLLQAIDDLYDDVGTDTTERRTRLEELLQTANARDMAQRFYDLAAQDWNNGLRMAAMEKLGTVLHLIQDMTVPTHA